MNNKLDDLRMKTGDHDVIEDGEHTIGQPGAKTSASDDQVKTPQQNDTGTPLYLRVLTRLQVWAGKTIERCKDADEAGRVALVLSGVLALIACMAATQSLGLLIASRIVSMKSPQWPVISMIVSSCMSVLAYLPVVLWIPGMMRTLRTDSWLGKPVWKLSKAKTIVLVPSVAVALIAVIQLAGRAFKAVYANGMKSNAGSFDSGAIIKMALDDPSPLLVVSALIIVVLTIIIAPFCEELLFRGIIGKAILESAFVTSPNGVKTRPRRAVACIVSGLVFGLMHLVAAADPQQAMLSVLSMTLMGAVLTAVDDAARSIRPSIAIHALYNSIVLALMVIAL